MTQLRRASEFFVCRPDCRTCEGEGIVCEEHPHRAWRDGDGCCGAPGMPCPFSPQSKVMDAPPLE